MGLPQKKTSGLTYADYLNWTQDERFELIEGAQILAGASGGPAGLRLRPGTGQLWQTPYLRINRHTRQPHPARSGNRLEATATRSAEQPKLSPLFLSGADHGRI